MLQHRLQQYIVVYIILKVHHIPFRVVLRIPHKPPEKSIRHAVVRTSRLRLFTVIAKYLV